MSSHWLHWKAKSSLWALPVSNWGVYCKIHLVTFLYIFLLVDCFKELSLTELKSKEFTLCSGSFKHKIHLVTFLYIFLLVYCFKWALIDHKIHLVTFLYIFLLVYCFKWALIDHIEKWRVHSVLWYYYFHNGPIHLCLVIMILEIMIYQVLQLKMSIENILHWLQC